MLKKSLPVLASLALIASSCTVKEQCLECLTPVSVHVNDFRITIDTFASTKATPATEYENLKALTLAFYDGETEVYKSTQLQGDAGFGDFSINLPLGTYTMVVLGYSRYEGDVLTLTSPTSAAFTAGRVGETFACTDEITISGTEAVEVEATLDRIISKLYVVSSDKKPVGVETIRITFSGGAKAFNPTTGLSTSNNGFSNTLNVSSETGYRTGSICYLFLNSVQQTMDITIEALDAEDEVLFSKIVRNVPFKMNRCTRLDGKIYTETLPGSTSFQVNADWLTEIGIGF